MIRDRCHTSHEVAPFKSDGSPDLHSSRCVRDVGHESEWGVLVRVGDAMLPRAALKGEHVCEKGHIWEDGL